MKKILVLLFISKTLSALPMDGLKDLNNKTAQFTTNKNTELVVFWATWCPSCKSKISNELPKLNENKDISVVLINTEKDFERVKKFTEKQDIKLPVFVDAEKALRNKYNILAVPAWMVFKREEKSKPWHMTASGLAFENADVSKALGVTITD